MPTKPELQFDDRFVFTSHLPNDLGPFGFAAELRHTRAFLTSDPLLFGEIELLRNMSERETQEPFTQGAKLPDPEAFEYPTSSTARTRLQRLRGALLHLAELGLITDSLDTPFGAFLTRKGIMVLALIGAMAPLRSEADCVAAMPSAGKA